MIYIIADQITERLKYTVEWIFTEQLGIAYKIVLEQELTSIPINAVIINYSDQKYDANIWIKPCTILSDTGIQHYVLSYHRWKHTAILFYNQPGSLIPFDLFGAIFFLLARIEEYYPIKRDKHNRFPAKSSVAFQYSFLQEPVIDLWLLEFGKIMEKHFKLTPKQRSFKFVPTFDIDIAYCYKEKPLFRNLLGGTKDLIKGKFALVKLRSLVVSGKADDPYDNFEWLSNLQNTHKIKPIFFWLLAQNETSLDTNNNPESNAMKALLNQFKDKVSYGIHPSYASHESDDLLIAEINILKKYSSVQKSRQHYIKLSLPDTFHQLIRIGIKEDYTMGYPDANGFRAGTSQSFVWYDVTKEHTTELRVHPFIFMDATSIFYSKEKPEAAFASLERMMWQLKKTNGTLTTIFHNYTLGNQGPYKGWRKMYEKLVETATLPLSSMTIL